MPDRSKKLTLRPVVMDDAKRIFDWRNLPQLIGLGSSQRPVTWEEHTSWLARSLVDPGSRLFMIMIDLEHIGQIRFNQVAETSGDWTISVYLDPTWAGQGLGRQAIAEASSDLLRGPAKRVLAYIRDENTASIRAFSGAGYVPSKDEKLSRAGHVVLVRQEL